MAKEQRDWHRLFGLILTDFFTGSPFHVELEKDLSLLKQLLDVVILRRTPGVFTGRLPDGLKELANHNLITFKSYREALDAWAMKELIRHDVNYRKQVSPSPDDLLPDEEFHLFAVCARYPHNLAQQVPWTERQPGVYDCRWGTDTVRVIVLGQLPREEHNAPLHLFSASQEQVRYGTEHYRQRRRDEHAAVSSAGAVPEGGARHAVHDGRLHQGLHQGPPQGSLPRGAPAAVAAGGTLEGVVPRGDPCRPPAGGAIEGAIHGGYCRFVEATQGR